MTQSAQPQLNLSGSRLFTTWLASVGGSLVFTTYQAGKVFAIGLDQNGKMSVYERTFDRPMGLGVGDRQLWLSASYQMWRFSDFFEPGTQSVDGHDAVYVPTRAHTTGDIDVHDVHVRKDGTPLFVVTRFNCLATLAEDSSFTPVWRPPFIDRIAAEDRCHLNGMAVVDDVPRYATCVGTGNVSESWRDHRRDGGVLIDCQSNEIIAQGLSMPHSPRLHNGKLWMLNSGTGEFGVVDRDAGKFEPVSFLPGFCRGLAFAGNYALIGLSQARKGGSFDGLALGERLDAENLTAKCGVCIVNLETGDVEHRLEIEGIVDELYDVGFIKGVINPKLVGLKGDEIRMFIKPDHE